MTPDLERAARALFNALAPGFPGNWEATSDEAKEVWYRTTSAVIEALAEPSEAMVEAAHNHSFHGMRAAIRAAMLAALGRPTDG